MVAKVWKGGNFMEHWVLGDGVHASYISDVDVDKQTGIPYFCGYVVDDKTKAAVWWQQELLFTFDQESINSNAAITYSEATQIDVENGGVYMLGLYEVEGAVMLGVIWKDNEIELSAGSYFESLQGICCMDDSYYYGYNSRDHQYTSVMKSDQSEMLRLNSVSRILSSVTGIYVIGEDFDSHFCVWKNFEEQFQIENCNALYDIAVVETSVIPNDYYGFLYQPNHATITLDPNSSMGSEYGDFQARFQYYPSGLLYIQRAISVYSNSEICDYDHTYRFVYDSDLHVINQYDTYYGDWGAAPYQNRYVYEDGLLMTYTRYFDDYHNDAMRLEDSTSYAYDELGRLQTEKQLRVNRYYKELVYEYHDNETVVTTEGYSNGTNGDWIRLNKETRGFSEDSLLLTQQNEPYNDSATLVTYGYDEQGHRVSALTQKRYDGVWENQKLVQYHFNPQGHLTLAETKLWQENEWVDANRAIYELDAMGYPVVVTFEKWNGESWVNGVWQNDFCLYNEDYLKQQNDLLYNYRNSIHKIELSYIATENPREPLLPNNSDWYYEIENEDGAITYQHLEYAADTTINEERPKIIVRSNTHYDRDSILTEVTHEYVYEEDGKVYWWNKDLEEFTVLYDFTAQTGDEWEIKVGTESITVHVDDVDTYEYEGRAFKRLHISDVCNIFKGEIVAGFGHMTSFFPEKLMNRNAKFTVDGLRCYWVDDILLYHNGDEDCDAIYAELHNGIEESTDNAVFAIYPNPANNVLTVAVRLPQCDSPTSGQNKYRITNLMGQTLLQGSINAEKQQIDVSGLSEGMYFITLGEMTLKFVVK